MEVGLTQNFFLENHPKIALNQYRYFGVVYTIYSVYNAIGDFTVTSFAVSRGHPAPLVGKRLLAGGLRVYFCLYSCLVYINFAHTQDHDYVLYLCGGTSGVVWTACFSLLSSKKMENEENSGWMRSCKQWLSGEADVPTIIFINNCLL